MEEKIKTKIIWRGFFIRLLLLFFTVVFSIAGYFGYKFYKLEKEIFEEATVEENLNTGKNDSTFFETAKNLIIKEKATLRGEEKKRINILLLGMGGEGHKGKYLTDTIMLVSINPETYQAAFLSIPRDLYVNIPETEIYTKINAVYAYELKNEEKNSAYALAKLKEAIKEITGQEIDYYLTLDFDGFKKIIDELGGISVEVTEDIFDSHYPGSNFSYETFEIKKGFHHLNGETALKYARVRHIVGGDFGRARRQQQILAAAKNKAFSLQQFADLGKLNNLIDILGEHLKTDIHFNEIPAFLELTEKVNIYQSINKVLDAWSADSLLASSHVSLGGATAYVLIPRAKNYSQIQELSDNIFDLATIEREKEEIEKENARITIFSDNYSQLYSITQVFDRWGYKTGMRQNDEILSRCKNDSIIFNNSTEAKLFTLNDLSDKIKAEIIDEKFPDYDEADILICLSSKTSEYFGKQIYDQQNEDEELKEKSVVDENGNILYNKE